MQVSHGHLGAGLAGDRDGRGRVSPATEASRCLVRYSEVEASHWRIELAGVEPAAVTAAVTAFLAADAIPVQRMTKNGRRTLDARAAVVTLLTGGTMVDLVVRLATPAVRPDDVLAGLRDVAGLEPSLPPQVTRLARGRLRADGSLSDPLADDRG